MARKPYNISDEERERRSEEMRQRNQDPDFRQAQAKARDERKRAEEATGLVPCAAPGPEPDLDEPIDLLAEYKKIARDGKASPKQRLDALDAIRKLEEQTAAPAGSIDQAAAIARILRRSEEYRAAKCLDDWRRDWQDILDEHFPGYGVSIVKIQRWPETVSARPDSTPPSPEPEIEPEIEPDLESVADALPTADPAVTVMAAVHTRERREWGPKDGTGSGPERFESVLGPCPY